MSRADFYLIGKPRFMAQPLLLVCELARKAFDANMHVLILANDMSQAEALDDLLWSFDPDAFLPHEIFNAEENEDDEIVPILIATPDMDPPARALVINLREVCAAGPFDRVLEVVPADPNLRAPLRERWTEYKARGYTLNSYEM
ncbi:DNA polymerase III subunit chi [Lysobacter sp. HDW10]|jgi:DNA polymerase-3 subunit chi|uniref:DNA polymerase III subunit chi n=1 Tax=Lysobacter sp. HDW10 TaxID=2714936 RepID=UPI00140CAFAE|nr:DNA polymerase III subunit chi [Lysobacter sp. HDW10]QIK80396.1 DNA polymerase III subunit chi [Lysobacter sp. HDW10]